jgi:hypothetical protein
MMTSTLFTLLIIMFSDSSSGSGGAGVGAGGRDGGGDGAMADSAEMVGSRSAFMGLDIGWTSAIPAGHIANPWVPIVLQLGFSYFITATFADAYYLCVLTILLSYCADRELNDPTGFYCMKPSLRKAVEVSRKALVLTAQRSSSGIELGGGGGKAVRVNEGKQHSSQEAVGTEEVVTLWEQPQAQAPPSSEEMRAESGGGEKEKKGKKDKKGKKKKGKKKKKKGNAQEVAEPIDEVCVEEMQASSSMELVQNPMKSQDV